MYSVLKHTHMLTCTTVVSLLFTAELLAIVYNVSTSSCHIFLQSVSSSPFSVKWLLAHLPGVFVSQSSGQHFYFILLALSAAFDKTDHLPS